MLQYYFLVLERSLCNDEYIFFVNAQTHFSFLAIVHVCCPPQTMGHVAASTWPEPTLPAWVSPYYAAPCPILSCSLMGVSWPQPPAGRVSQGALCAPHVLAKAINKAISSVKQTNKKASVFTCCPLSSGALLGRGETGQRGGEERELIITVIHKQNATLQLAHSWWGLSFRSFPHLCHHMSASTQTQHTQWCSPLLLQRMTQLVWPWSQSSHSVLEQYKRSEARDPNRRFSYFSKGKTQDSDVWVDGT